MPATSAPAAGSPIGPAGGALTFFGGGVRLSVPSGALSAPASLGVSFRAAGTVPLDPHAVGSSFFEVTPSGTVFATPATLTIRYQSGLRPSGTPEQELRLHVLRGSSWEPLAGGVDPATGEASAPISGAGVYGVRWTGPAANCSDAHDRDFDFWLGAWNLNELTRNQSAGTNDISRDESGCVVEEDYRSNVQGRSVSLFSRLDGQWHQTYIDSSGIRAVLVGNLEGRRMVLATSSVTRSVWDPQSDGSVHFTQERTADGGRTWIPTFDSSYTRR